MSEIDQFWRYAKAATLSASYAETEGERQGQLDLAQTWTLAALIDRHAQPDTAIAAKDRSVAAS
jgi:hypothetical protein